MVYVYCRGARQPMCWPVYPSSPLCGAGSKNAMGEVAKMNARCNDVANKDSRRGFRVHQTTVTSHTHQVARHGTATVLSAAAVLAVAWILRVVIGVMPLTVAVFGQLGVKKRRVRVKAMLVVSPQLHRVQPTRGSRPIRMVFQPVRSQPRRPTPNQHKKSRSKAPA